MVAVSGRININVSWLRFDDSRIQILWVQKSYPPLHVIAEEKNRLVLIYDLHSRLNLVNVVLPEVVVIRPQVASLNFNHKHMLQSLLAHATRNETSSS